MSAQKYVTIGGTVYFHFALNDTSGSGADGSAPLFDVRLCGAASSAAPVLSGTPTLLSHANYPDGCYEIAIVASLANGFADGASYAVFCKATVSGQNPTGFVGSFDIGGIDGYDFYRALRLILAATGGKLSGAGTNTEVMRAADDSKARITATVDASGNRSAITLDAT